MTGLQRSHKKTGGAHDQDLGPQHVVERPEGMWAVASWLPVERIDIGGAFGKKQGAEISGQESQRPGAMIEEEDGFLLWESNSIVRYLAAKHTAGTLEPADASARAGQKWMDWQLSVRDRRSRRCSGA